MYRGRLVEVGPVEQVCSEPRHPYTETLVRATRGLPLKNAEPTADRTDTGCPYVSRCAYRKENCKKELPPLLENVAEHFCACHYPLGGTSDV